MHEKSSTVPEKTGTDMGLMNLVSMSDDSEQHSRQHKGNSGNRSSKKP